MFILLAVHHIPYNMCETLWFLDLFCRMKYIYFYYPALLHQQWGHDETLWDSHVSELGMLFDSL